jgi:hypothetical protein
MEVNKENVGQKKHNLIQAILSVNDMRILSRENIVSIFKDEVKLFLNTNDIYPSTDVKIAGKS